MGTTPGTVKLLFTVRNKTTLVEKTQAVEIVVNTSIFNFTAAGTSNNQITTTPVNVNFNLAQTGGGADTYNLIFNTSATGTFTYAGVTYTAGQVIPFTVGSSNGSYKGSVGGAHDITFTASNQNNVTKTATVSLNYINNDFNLSSSGDGSLNVNTSKSFNVFLSQAVTDPTITYEVKYDIASGSIGTGTLSNGGTSMPFGTYAPINTGTTAVIFNGTAEGIVNVVVSIKSSNGIVKTSTLSFNVATVSYTFTGASQSNTVFVNGSTPINFDITESGTSGTNYEMKYAVTSGNAEIRNGATLEGANVYAPVSIGSFNRTFVGTTAGTAQILFTVRNKTTLVEKSQSISINVNNSVFTFNATRTNTNQVVNSPVNVNFNLTQTGGTGDTYSLIFNTSSTGSFKYDGITYTAGQAIPFVIGASVGEYIGAVSGSHDVTFTATNQLNLSKTASVSLNYINNDFTLSSSGDGTLFVNQTKDFNVFLSQLIPDPSLTYQVKYSFDSGTTGNGTITNGGSPVALGTYQPIALGSNLLTFNASALGIVNLLIEVKNSNGLLKSTVVMFDAKSAEFTFTGGASSPNVYTDEDTNFVFDLNEIAPTGTDYEMKYSIQQGGGTIKNTSGNSVPALIWDDVALGNFVWKFKPTASGQNTLIFTVRNKITLQEKTTTITVNAYQKPKLTNIRTWHIRDNSQGCFNGCEYDYRYLLKYDLTLNSGATLKSIVFNITPLGSTPMNFSLTSFPVFANGFITVAFYGDSNSRPSWNYRTYSLVVTDSNNISTTISGLTFTDNETDSQ